MVRRLSMFGNPGGASESGAALIQVLIVAAVIGVTVFFTMQFLRNADRASMRLIHRNDNVNFSSLFADHLSDRNYVKGLSTTLIQVGSGPPIQYW